VSFVSEFEPKKLWYHFDQILTIPRGSKNEHSICQYVCDVARRNNLNYIQDAIGNVIVTKAASSGFENSPSTILQCHLDMVNEKNSDVVHDFNQDPLRPLQIGEYLTADGTTLGADNGIGIAACLAVLEDQEIQHGPLECLFTVDEETGLTGAQQLREGILKGKRMINLDFTSPSMAAGESRMAFSEDRFDRAERWPLRCGYPFAEGKCNPVVGSHSLLPVTEIQVPGLSI